MSENMLSRVFITGKNGQVGRELVERAAELNIDAVSFDSSELNICDREKVIATIADYKPKVVINAAAYTAVDKAEEEADLAYAVNRDGVENLALACKALNIPLIHISTDYVFDGEKDSPYLESDSPNPIGVYGASKYAGEKVLKDTWEKHIIVRVSWVFGFHGNNFVKTMLRLGNERDELAVVCDQYGAPTSAKYIANELLMCDAEKWGLYHLVSNPVVSWFEFADKIFERALSYRLIERAPILNSLISTEYPTPVKRPLNSKLDTICECQFSVSNWPDELENMLESLL